MKKVFLTSILLLFVNFFFANSSGPETITISKLIKFEISNFEVSNLDSGYIGNTKFRKNNCETGAYSFFNPFYEQPELANAKVSSKNFVGGVSITISSIINERNFNLQNIEISDDNSQAEVDIIEGNVIFKSKFYGENLTEEYIINAFSGFNNSSLLAEEDCPPCVVIGILAIAALCENAQNSCTPCNGTLTVTACGCTCS